MLRLRKKKALLANKKTARIRGPSLKTYLQGGEGVFALFTLQLLFSQLQSLRLLLFSQQQSFPRTCPCLQP